MKLVMSVVISVSSFLHDFNNFTLSRFEASKNRKNRFQDEIPVPNRGKRVRK